MEYKTVNPRPHEGIKKKLIHGSSSEKIHENIIQLKTKRKKFSIIWISDAHFDSLKSERKFMHSILKEYPDDFIVIGGDSVDVMQGRNDRRASKGSNEFSRSDYFNEVEEFVRKEVHDKYKDRIIAWNRGNHDNSIINHNEIDMIKHICKDETPIGDISGYISVACEINGPATPKCLIYYSHQPISGGQRSKGMLSVDIVRGKYPDADIFITEHIHTSWVHPESKESIDPSHRFLNSKIQWFVQNTTLKNEFKGSRNGFHHEIVKSGRQIVGVTRLSFELNSRDKAKSKKLVPKMPEIIVMK